MELSVLGLVTRNRDGLLTLPYAVLKQNNQVLGPADLAGAIGAEEGATVPHLLKRFCDGGASLWIYKWTIIRATPSASGIYEPVTTEESQLEVLNGMRRREEYFSRLRSSVERWLNGEPEEPTREPIPESVRLFVWQRDGGQCVVCRSRERLEFDHIIPIVKGGSTTERNIQLLCESCNRKKGAQV